MLKKEIIFGFHAVEAILKKSPHRILQLYCQEDKDSKRLQPIVHMAEQQQVPIQRLSKIKLDQWTNGARHQGLLVEARCLANKTEKDLWSLIAHLEKPPFLLLLDGLQDPHNLGACLRSANAAGADAVVITQDRSVGVTPTVRKIAAGAAETTPVIAVVNLANTLRQLKKLGLWIYGLDGAAKQSLYSADLKGAVALVLGTESHGLRRLTKTLCDGVLAIPMQGTVESLNVSVAAGISLFEVVRQRQFKCLIH